VHRGGGWAYQPAGNRVRNEFEGTLQERDRARGASGLGPGAPLRLCAIDVNPPPVDLINKRRMNTLLETLAVNREFI
jgi:hypothetical protein